MGDSLGSKIKAIRKEKKMTQSELAGSGLSRTMLSKLENDLAQPSLSTIEYLAKRLEVPVSTFVSEPTEKTNKIYENALNYVQSLANENEYESICGFMAEFLKTHDLTEDRAGGMLLLYYGLSCRKCGNRTDAFQMLSEAANLLEQDTSPYYLALAHYHLSLYYFDVGNVSMDEHHAYEALQNLSASSFKDILLEIRLLYNYAFIQIGKKEPDRAVPILLQALNVQEKQGLNYMSGKIFMLLGLAYSNLEEYTSAIEYTRQAVRYYVYSNQKIEQISAMHNLGLYNLSLGNIDLANKILNVCYKHHKNENNKRKEFELMVEILLSEFLADSSSDPSFKIDTIVPELLCDYDRQIFTFIQALNEYKKDNANDSLKLLKNIDASHSKPLRIAIQKLTAECLSATGDYKTAYELLKDQEFF